MGYKHRDMRRRHAISPGFAGHYQDLGISSLKGHDSACNLILSVAKPMHQRASIQPNPDSRFPQIIECFPIYMHTTALRPRMDSYACIIPPSPPRCRAVACSSPWRTTPDLDPAARMRRTRSAPCYHAIVMFLYSYVFMDCIINCAF